MTQYIIPLPEFIWDKDALYNAQNNHPNYKANLLFEQLHNFDTSTGSKMWDLWEYDIPETKALESRFDCRTDSKFTKVLAGGYMPKHIDPHRTAVVMFPLTDDPSPIVYFDGDNEIFKHEYTCATIINAKIHHGVPVNETDRIAFQVNLYLPWEDVIEMNNNGTLFS